MNNCKVCNKETSNRIYCGNECKFSDKDYNKSRSIKPILNDNEFLVECNHCGKQSKDVNNLSGALTIHLRDVHNITSNPLSNYTTILNEIVIEKIQCKVCDWKTKDLENKSGQFTVHIKRAHGLTPLEYTNHYPEHSHLFERKLGKIDSLKNSDVYCEICNKRFHKISNTHLKSHGIAMDDYKQKFPNSKILSDALSELHSYYSTITNQTREHTFKSKPEFEIIEFLNENGIDNIIHTYKKFGIELDIFLQDYNLAIEYDGYPWHTEFFGGKEQYYHLNKTEICEKNDIKLLHVFADEWKDKQEIVKLKILSNIESTQKKVYARKCSVIVPTKSQKKEFLQSYHIQGNCKSSIIYGLEYEGNLIAIGTFSKPRIGMGRKKEISFEFELVRYASKYSIIGGLDKLISAMKNDHPEIISLYSYADRRWSSIISNIYSSTNWELDSITTPNYWYFYKGNRKHRYSFTKQRLINMGGSPDLTETENAIALKLDRIWDCGSLKYIKDVTSI